MGFKYFNNEKIITMFFHSDSGFWLILTEYSTHRIKAGDMDGLIKDGVFK